MAIAERITLVLPFPPSVDAAYRNVSARERQYFKHRKGRTYTKPMQAWCDAATIARFEQVPMLRLHIPGKVVGLYELARPDNRHRDAQNYVKAPADWLTAQKIIEDDRLEDAALAGWVDCPDFAGLRLAAGRGGGGAALAGRVPGGAPGRRSCGVGAVRGRGSGMRGFAALGLHRPKFAVNVGGVLRIASNYRAAMVAVAGERCAVAGPSDTCRAWRHLPLLLVPDLLAAAPHGAEPVAVEIAEGATPLPRFEHPESAFYLFGPEDGSLPEEVRARCAASVYVPTAQCMNLAVTAGVVLYDRMAKRGEAHDPPGTIWPKRRARNAGEQQERPA